MNAQIHTLGDPAMHFWLTRSVARVMGVSLSEAMDMNLLTPKGYAEMVTRCRTCPHVATCQKWLGEYHERPADAPAHCLLRDSLSSLARNVPA